MIFDKSTPVMQYDLDMNLIAEFPSMTLAAKSIVGKYASFQKIKVHQKSIYAAATGSHNSKTAYGFKWRVKNNN